MSLYDVWPLPFPRRLGTARHSVIEWKVARREGSTPGLEAREILIAAAAGELSSCYLLEFLSCSSLTSVFLSSLKTRAQK